MKINLKNRGFKISYDGFQKIGKSYKTYTSCFISNVCSISRFSNMAYDETYAVMTRTQYRHGLVEVITEAGAIFQFPVKVNGKYELQIIEVDNKVISDLEENKENLDSIKIVEG